jgi:hypothetical protein
MRHLEPQLAGSMPRQPAQGDTSRTWQSLAGPLLLPVTPALHRPQGCESWQPISLSSSQLQARLLCLLLEERGAAQPSSPWVAALHGYLTAHPLLPLLLHHRRPGAGQPSPGRGAAQPRGGAGTWKRPESQEEEAPLVEGRRDRERILEALADHTAAAGYTLLR